MRLSPKALKWVLRFYPPFFFQRIWVQKVHADFRQIDIVIRKSLLNMNINRTIFGGTIFSAVDPIHTLLLDQLLRRAGIGKTVTWLKSAKIEYLKPATRHLSFSVRLHDDEVRETLDEVKNKGKVIKTFDIHILDRDGLLCARSNNEIYIRDLTFGGKTRNFEDVQPDSVERGSNNHRGRADTTR
ncbi:MAG TPA: YiiD C-terminal domain-containing protein [Sphingobacterium sp.]|jgi:acyl-coenzyme A thioesterase PaaI-like protein|nr:YiiD C-terminal domain-containing protein [Sphingobacterium sp.]